MRQENQDWTDFIDPIDLYQIAEDETFKKESFGNTIKIYPDKSNDIATADIILVGCDDGKNKGNLYAVANAVRAKFYTLMNWFPSIQLMDMGNIKVGNTLKDTLAAIEIVISSLLTQNKKIILIGNQHPLCLGQYAAYKKLNQLVSYVNVDALMDMDQNGVEKKDNFLLDILCTEPNFIKHYTHLAFQSYFVSPAFLETIDKLRMDCVRVGKMQENMEAVEPLIRTANMMSIDMNALQHSYAPTNSLSGNGLTGAEVCMLCQYAGFSSSLNSLSLFADTIYPDKHQITAMQIAQMIWYYIEGIQQGKQEAALTDTAAFNEYHIQFGHIDALFLQSKKTDKWWMQLSNGRYIPCSKWDYYTAANNEIPECWLRAMERL